MFMRWSRSLGAKREHGGNKGAAGAFPAGRSWRTPASVSRSMTTSSNPMRRRPDLHVGGATSLCNTGPALCCPLPSPDPMLGFGSEAESFPKNGLPTWPTPMSTTTTKRPNQPGMPWKLLEIAMRVGVEFQQGRCASDWPEPRACLQRPRRDVDPHGSQRPIAPIESPQNRWREHVN